MRYQDVVGARRACDDGGEERSVVGRRDVHMRQRVCASVGGARRVSDLDVRVSGQSSRM